jgi:two-component system, cell cycle response regulator DivK
VNKKILIVEDNEDNLKLFSEVLGYEGYDIFEAKNAIEGINLARTEIPHLILTGIQMPLMNGFEMLRILKSDSSTTHIPFIAITSYGIKGGREKFINYGFADYIQKPVNLKEFVRTVKKYI